MIDEHHRALSGILFVKDMDAAIERALMFLHEQRVIILQQGLSVFRSAMTIRFQPEARSQKYETSDYQRDKTKRQRNGVPFDGLARGGLQSDP